MYENWLSNSSTQKVGGVDFERSGACGESVSIAAKPVLTELRLQMERAIDSSSPLPQHGKNM